MSAFDLPIPVIETERLTLRGYRDSDLDALAAFYATDRSKMVGGPKSRQDSWRALMSILGHWVLRDHGFWMIEDTATGIAAGGVGILNHEGWDEPELGWHVYEGFEGKGIAYEAALAARDYAARHFGLDGMISYIEPANTRSAALAKRLGATYERDGVVLGHSCHVYRHPKIAKAA